MWDQALDDPYNSKHFLCRIREKCDIPTTKQYLQREQVMDNQSPPIHDTETVFGSLHNAKKFVNTEISTGRFKKCYYLDIEERPQSLHYPYRCMPKCGKNSFNTTKGRHGNEMLIGCPQNCLCYHQKWLGRIKRKISFTWKWLFRRLGQLKRTITHTISSMHWLERTMIVLAIMVYKLPAIFDKIAPVMMHLCSKFP